MAGYDPKRPRPGASEEFDGPAPVEALLDAPEPDAPEPDAPEPDQPPVEALLDPPEPDAPEPDQPPVEALLDPRSRRPEPDQAEPGPGPGGSAAADEEVPEITQLADGDEVDLREPTAPVVGRAAMPGAATTESPVPVAPAPEEGTANRAVLVVGAVVAGVLVAVLAILLGRRRRRD